VRTLGWNGAGRWPFPATALFVWLTVYPSIRRSAGGLRPLASAPLAAPLHGTPESNPSGILSATILRSWCLGQFQLSFSGSRAGTPPLRRTSAPARRRPAVQIAYACL